MEIRKKRNFEIERRKKQKRRTFTGVLIVLIILAVVVFCYAIWDMQNRRTIMTFKGTRVATTDFRFFNLMQALQGESPNELTRDVAMESLIHTMVVRDRAERHNISVTSDEIAELMQYAADLREQINWQSPGALNFISDRRIAELSSIWGLHEQLMDIYVPGYDIDEFEVEQRLQEHLEASLEFLTEREVKYIASSDFSALENIRAEFNAGADFDALRREHSIFFDPEVEATMDFWDFLTLYEIWDGWMDMLPLEAGEVSEIFEANDTFFLVLIKSRGIDEEVLEEEGVVFRENHIAQRRTEVFAEVLDEWIENAEYTINERAFRRF